MEHKNSANGLISTISSVENVTITRWNTTKSATFGEDNRRICIIAAIVGCAILMLAMAIALITFVTSWQLRVKRPHMIAFNFCVSISVLYVGIVTSLIQQMVAGLIVVEGCIIAAVFILYGSYLSWSWLVVHWCYLAFTASKTTTPHISNFFVKVAIPTYTIPSAWISLVVIAKSTTQLEFVDIETCLFEADVATWSFSGVYLLICVIVSCYCCIVSILIVTYKMPANAVITKTKRTILDIKRLTVISLSVLACTTCTFLLHFYKRERLEYKIIQVTHGGMSMLFGIVVVFGLVFRSSEFQIHWKSLFLGRNPTREISLQRTFSRMNSLSSKKSPTRKAKYGTNQPNEYDQHKEYSPKIKPRDSTMTTQDFDDVFHTLKRDSAKNTVNSSKDIIKTSEGEKNKSSMTRNLFRSSMKRLHKLTSSSSIGNVESKENQDVHIQKINTLTLTSSLSTFNDEKTHRKSSF